MQSSSLNIVPLDAKLQELSVRFSCGNNFIDSFLRSSVALDIGFGKTFVWLTEDRETIIGFYNIATGELNQWYDDKCWKIGGSAHINEFAIHNTFRGCFVNDTVRMSDLLLGDCINRIIKLREQVGFSFVTLQSTDEGKSLYLRNGFEIIEEDMELVKLEGIEDICTPMYFAIDVE